MTRKVRYETTDEEAIGEYEKSAWSYPRAVVVRMENGELAEVIGYDGSADSPEDNYLYRDFSWVEPALNEAYELGLKHGREQS